MASKSYILSNGTYVKKAYVGFSWTMLFFGVLPTLFRKDWKTFAILFVLQILTFNIASIVYSFFWNNHHFNRLLDSGYKVDSMPDGATTDSTKNKLGRVTLPMVG